MTLQARALRVDDGVTGEAWCPTAWTDHTLIIDQDDVAGVDGIGFATVLKVAGRLSDPIDDWYLWCTSHDNSDGPFLFTAPSPKGPWTIANSGNELSLSIPSGYGDISPVFALWHPVEEEIWLYSSSAMHVSPWEQSSFLYKCTDSVEGLTYSLANSGNPVVEAGGAGSGPADGYTATYPTVIHDRGKFLLAYQGTRDSGASEDGARVCLALSPSGDGSFAKTTLDSSERAHSAFGNDPGDDSLKGGSYSPLLFRNDHGLWVYYSYADAPGDLADWGPSRCRRKLDTRGWSDHFLSGLGDQTDDEQWDYPRRVPSDIVYDNGEFIMFYNGGGSTVAGTDEAIGCAVCEFPQYGFDTTWGKG